MPCRVGAEAAGPTIQRVSAGVASADGVVRSSSASPPRSVAASDSRRTATSPTPRSLRSSPMTAPTARQRNASSIAHKTSRACVAVTVTSRSGAKADFVEAGSIGRAAFARRHLLGDPQHGARGSAAGERQREAGRGRDLGLAGRGDLVQRRRRQPAAQHVVDFGDAERQQRRRLVEERVLALDLHNGAAERGDEVAPLLPAARRRHGRKGRVGHDWSGNQRFERICSCFVLIDS